MGWKGKKKEAGNRVTILVCLELRAFPGCGNFRAKNEKNPGKLG